VGKSRKRSSPEGATENIFRKIFQFFGESMGLQAHEEVSANDGFSRGFGDGETSIRAQL